MSHGHTVCVQTVYEKLGHAEVVQVALSDDSPATRDKEMKKFADTYFKQFRKTPNGMQRLVSVWEVRIVLTSLARHIC